jgi:hypothetical protein
MSEVRKQGLDAHLGFCGKEIEIVFAILLTNRVIGLDFCHSEWITTLRDPVADEEIVTEVQKQQQQNHGREDALHGIRPLDLCDSPLALGGVQR